MWRHNGFKIETTKQVLLPDGSEPNVLLDVFGTLYLQNVSANEEGNYTCAVGSQKMQVNTIFVVSKSRILGGGMLESN